MRDMQIDIFKMPRMGREEYDRLVEEEYICRIAFKGEKHPYIAPFLYVFDGKFLYFLSTNYGKKVQYFRDNPHVIVEIERYSPDLSDFRFVALPGCLVEVADEVQKRSVRQRFLRLIEDKGLSSNVLSALGYSPRDPIEALLKETHNSVWKLEGVKVNEIMGLKNQDIQQ